MCVHVSALVHVCMHCSVCVRINIIHTIIKAVDVETKVLILHNHETKAKKQDLFMHNIHNNNIMLAVVSSALDHNKIITCLV